VVKTLPNGDISIDKGDRPGGIVCDNTGNEVKTLLRAYLGVLRGLRGWSKRYYQYPKRAS